MVLKKQNIKISIKLSDAEKGLDLKLGELGTDGENIFIGGLDGNVSITLPIGTILFWMPVGFSNQNNGSPTNLSDSIFLNSGWRIANGDKIENQNSPFFGRYLPNLSGNIFLQGSSIGSIGTVGGSNIASHKHNIAHWHQSFNGANGNAGYITTDGNHRHYYLDNSPAGLYGAEEGGEVSVQPASGSNYRTTVSAGAHSHSFGNLPVADQSSGLYIDNIDHPNLGNSRNVDDLSDFTENRPKYINGIYIMRVL